MAAKTIPDTPEIRECRSGFAWAKANVRACGECDR